jgi:hypothetical protein
VRARLVFYRKRSIAWLISGVCVALGVRLDGATLTAKSVSFEDVSAAVSSAREGDTVMIPAGTASWTEQLALTKGITLQGQTSVQGKDPKEFVVRDGTIILDDVPRTRGKTSALVYGSFTPSQRPRISGITFREGAITTKNSAGAALYLEGTCPSVRVDHCSFYHLSRYNLWIGGNLFGVMDHCWAENDQGGERFSINHDTYAPAGDTNSYSNGDGSWIDGPHFGTGRAWFFEDCAFRSLGSGSHGSIDGQMGGRRVERHCYFFRTKDGFHGTESGGRHRGNRMCEAYANVYDLQDSASTMQLRAGTALYWGNTYLTSKEGFRSYILTVNRQRMAFRVWGAANGANPLDNNDTEGNGTYVPGHKPHLYFSGLMSRAELDATGLPTSISIDSLDGSKDWTGCSISDLSSGTVDYRECSGNSANVAVILSSEGPALRVAATANKHSRDHRWAPGDKVVIYRLARASLDQPGMGKADLLQGNPPSNDRWPNQKCEPLYSWLNTRNGSEFTTLFDVARVCPYPTVKGNRDYFNWKGPQTAQGRPFDGTSGVGSGTHAQRPRTCTPGRDGRGAPGVAYWETDTNTLYVCTASNKWTEYYKPYPYPHPLVAGAQEERGDSHGH